MPYFLGDSEHSVSTFFLVPLGTFWLQTTGCNAKTIITVGNSTLLEGPGQWAVGGLIILVVAISMYAFCCTCEWCPHQKWMHEKERQRLQENQNQICKSTAAVVAAAVTTGTSSLWSTTSVSPSTNNVHPSVNGNGNYAGYDNSNYGLGGVLQMQPSSPFTLAQYVQPYSPAKKVTRLITLFNNLPNAMEHYIPFDPGKGKTKTDLTLQWKSLSCGGLTKIYHAAVAVNGTIYSFGGKGHNEFKKEPIDVHVLNTLESPLQWKLLPIKTNTFTPSQRFYHTVVASGHLIYLWGGMASYEGDFSNQLHVFNTETVEWEKCEVKGEVPLGRADHTATVVRNKMYIFGGDFDSVRGFTNSMECQDLSTLCWSTIAPKNALPSPRVDHSATVLGNRFILIFGGAEAKDEFCNSLSCFDVETNEWTFPKGTGTIPEPRKDHCAFNHNELLYIFGGTGYNGGLNDVFRYDFEKLEWTKVILNGQSPDPRWMSQSVIIKQDVFIFGAANHKNFFDDTLVLTIE